MVVRSNEQVLRIFDEVLSRPDVSDELRAMLQYRRVQLGWHEGSYIWQKTGNRSVIDEKLEEIRELDLEFRLSDSAAQLLRSLVRVNTNEIYKDWGLTQTAVTSYLSEFLEYGGPETRALARGYIDSKPLELGDKVDLQAPTLFGDRIVSTSDFKGKIVLVDNWDTNCAPCISAFPNIQKVLDRYYEQGFRVMSIAYDGASQRQSVERIKSRLGLSWETLNGEGLWPAVTARYQVTGFPQYMLLDRQGQFVAGNEEIGDTSSLPTLIERLLSAPAGSESDQD